VPGNIATNDDSDFFLIGVYNQGSDPGSDPFADHDPFIGGLDLSAGTYYVAVAYYSNNPSAFAQMYTETPLFYSGDAISGVTPDATYENDVTCTDRSDPYEQCVGQYQLNIRDKFGAPTIPAVSGPGLLILALSLLIAAFGVRRMIG